MNRQVLTIHQYVARDQQYNSQSKCLLRSSTIKNLFHLAFVLLKDINFMVAIEYGLSNIISSLWKKDREKQWKALYPTNIRVCLLTDAIWAPVWSGSLERMKYGPFEEEQSRSCSLCNCCTFSWFNEWPCICLQRLQRKGITANLHRPFNQL